MPELTPADRVIALLEWGDVEEADADIEAATGWQGALWRGTRALMEGRFGACERFSAEAAHLAAGVPGAGDAGQALPGILAAAVCREQQRLAEAEILLRTLLDRHPAAPPGARALLALVRGEMGRDSQARLELERLLSFEPAPVTGRLSVLCLLGELAASVAAPPGQLDALYRRLRPHSGDFAVEVGGSAFYGSVAYVLGRLAQARGRTDQARSHYDEAVAAHERIGAPLLLAHSQRLLSALLRVHGDEGDWDRAVALLASAASIYEQLGVEARAVETQAVLARAGTGAGLDDRPTFRRQGSGWEVGHHDGGSGLPDAPGLHDIARLLATPLKTIHVTDLLGPVASEGADDRPPVLDPRTRFDYEARLAEVAAELTEAARAGDGIRLALARAERDTLSAALAGGPGGDLSEWARQAVVTRIRISLGRIEQVEPEVGRHLRCSIRTGTLCSYEPDRPVAWQL